MRLCLLSLLLVMLAAPPAYAEPPNNDAPANASVVSVFPSTLEVDTAEATTGPYELDCDAGLLVAAVGAPVKAVWYRLELASGVGRVRVTYDNYGASVILWELQGFTPSGEPILLQRACVYPQDPFPRYVSQRPVYMSVGTSIAASTSPFSVRVAAFDPATSVPNDAPYRATRIEALPYQIEQDTWDASHDADPAGCPAGAYVWYRYDPVATESIEVTLSSRGRYGGSTLAVYELGATVRTLGCDETYGNPATVTTSVAGGLPVLIGIGRQGVLSLSVRPVDGPGPGPDSRAGAVPLAFGTSTAFDTSGATLEPGEPTSCGAGGSMWFELPPRFRLADLVVAGPAVSLAAVANDDVLACSTDGTLSLASDSAATHIQLRSSDAVEGTVRLRFTPDYGQQLTDISPFEVGCGDPTGQPFMNSEVEVHQAVDPHHPAHLLVTWQQDRHREGGANGIGAAVSFDGGLTWTSRVMPGVSLCSGGPFFRATDPWAAIDADGTAYVMSLGYDRTPVDGAYGPNTVLLSRSEDGGLTWDDPIVVAVSPGGIFHDKETLTADPNTPGLLYAVWDAYPTNVAFPVFSRSEDGGRTWTPPVPLPTLGSGAGDQIAVLDDGTLVEIAPRFSMQSITSRDRGLTWSLPTTFAPREGMEGPPGVRGGAYIPSVSTDGRAVFVSWSDTYSTFFARSDDAGATWNVARIGGAHSGYPRRFTTAVASTDDGRLAVMTYMIAENDQAWLALATSADGGAPWSEQAITETFDMNRAPYSVGRGSFLGDYFGLGASGDDVLAAFAAVPQGEDLGVSNVYTLRVTP